MATMQLDTLHGIIDDTQGDNPKTEFTVALVNTSDTNPAYHSRHDIEDVFVDTVNGVVTLTFKG